MSHELSHLDALEAEAIHIMREVAAELERPVLLFSGGKDSIVLLRLAEKAFRPARFPFPVMHVDTGHNFPEVIEFRDRLVEELGERLIVASVQESIDKGRAVEETGPRASRNRLQTVTLLDAIERARLRRGVRRRPPRRGARPREGARSSASATTSASGTRGASARSCGSSTTAASARASTCASFPISNWTELDVWQYIAARETRAAVDLLRARARGLRARRDALRGQSDVRRAASTARSRSPRSVRYRTVGDMTLHRRRRARRAATLETVVAEIAATRITERGETRADDRVTEAAMEDRKREGYF